VGIVLWSSDGRPIGLIALISCKPQTRIQFVESILKMVAIRAAGELERTEAEEALKKRTDELDARVKERTADLSEAKRVLRDTEEKLRAANRGLQLRAEQLRQLTLELTKAEELERHRIAQILHDNLQQLLVGAKFSMRALLRCASDEAAVRSGLDDAVNLLDESIATSRRKRSLKSYECCCSRESGSSCSMSPNTPR